MQCTVKKYISPYVLSHLTCSQDDLTSQDLWGSTSVNLCDSPSAVCFSECFWNLYRLCNVFHDVPHHGHENCVTRHPLCGKAGPNPSLIFRCRVNDFCLLSLQSPGQQINFNRWQGSQSWHGMSLKHVLPPRVGILLQLLLNCIKDKWQRCWATTTASVHLGIQNCRPLLGGFNTFF